MYSSLDQEDNINIHANNVKFYSPTELSRICRQPNPSDFDYKIIKPIQEKNKHRHKHHHELSENPEMSKRKEKQKRKKHRKDNQELFLPTYEQYYLMMDQNQKEERKEEKKHRKHKTKEFSELNFQDLQCLINDYNGDVTTQPASLCNETRKSHRSRSIDQIPTKDIEGHLDQKNDKKHHQKRPKSAQIREDSFSRRSKEPHRYFPLEQMSEGRHILRTPTEDTFLNEQQHKSKKRKKKHHIMENKMADFVSIDRLNEQTIDFNNDKSRWQHERTSRKKYQDEERTNDGLLNEETDLIQNIQQIVDAEQEKYKRKRKEKKTKHKNKDEYDNKGSHALKKYLKKLMKEQGSIEEFTKIDEDVEKRRKEKRTRKDEKFYGEPLQNCFHNIIATEPETPKNFDNDKEQKKKKTKEKYPKNFIPLDLNLEEKEQEILHKSRKKHEHKIKRKTRHGSRRKSTDETIKHMSASADRERKCGNESFQELFPIQNHSTAAFFNLNHLRMKTKCKSETTFESLSKNGKDLVCLYDCAKEDMKFIEKQPKLASNEAKTKEEIKDSDQITKEHLFFDKEPLVVLPTADEKKIDDPFNMKKRNEMFEKALRRDFRPRPRFSRSRHHSSKILTKLEDKEDQKITKEVQCYDIGTCTILDNNFGEVLELLKGDPIIRPLSSDRKKSVFHVKKKTSIEELVETAERTLEKDNAAGISVKGIEPSKRLATSSSKNKLKINNLECKTLSVVSIIPKEQLCRKFEAEEQPPYDPSKTASISEVQNRDVSSGIANSNFDNKRQERLMKYYKSLGKASLQEKPADETPSFDNEMNFKNLITSKLSDYLRKLQEDREGNFFEFQTDNPMNPTVVKLILPIECNALRVNENVNEDIPKESFSDLYINYSDINEIEEDSGSVKNDSEVALSKDESSTLEEQKIGEPKGFLPFLNNFQFLPNFSVDEKNNPNNLGAFPDNFLTPGITEKSFSEKIPIPFRNLTSNNTDEIYHLSNDDKMYQAVKPAHEQSPIIRSNQHWDFSFCQESCNKMVNSQAKNETLFTNFLQNKVSKPEDVESCDLQLKNSAQIQFNQQISNNSQTYQKTMAEERIKKDESEAHQRANLEIFNCNKKFRFVNSQLSQNDPKSSKYGTVDQSEQQSYVESSPCQRNALDDKKTSQTFEHKKEEDSPLCLQDRKEVEEEIHRLQLQITKRYQEELQKRSNKETYLQYEEGSSLKHGPRTEPFGRQNQNRKDDMNKGYKSITNNTMRSPERTDESFQYHCKTRGNENVKNEAEEVEDWADQERGNKHIEVLKNPKSIPKNSFIPRRKLKLVESTDNTQQKTSSSLENGSEQTLTQEGNYEESYFNNSQDNNSFWEYETVKEQMIRDETIDKKELEKSVEKCLAWNDKNSATVVMSVSFAKPSVEEKKGNSSAKRSSIPVVKRETLMSSSVLGQSTTAITENKQTSLFLTKVFKSPPGQSSYERRKSYDSKIRRNIKRRNLNGSQKPAPLVYEVRYCNVINQNKDMQEMKREENSTCQSADRVTSIKSCSSSSTDPSCCLKEGQYGFANDDRSINVIMSRSHTSSSDTDDLRDFIENELFCETCCDPQKTTNITEKTIDNVSVRSYAIENVKFKLQKSKNYKQKSKIGVKCSKISSLGNGRRLRLVGRANKSKKKRVWERRTKEYFDCQDVTTNPSKNEEMTEDLCVFFENRKLSEVSNSVSSVSTLQEFYKDQDLESIDDNTVIHCDTNSEAASSVHSRETVKNLVLEEIREYKSTIDSGYLTKEVEVNCSDSTLDSGIRDAQNFFWEVLKSKQQEKIKNSNCNKKDLIKLKTDLLFPDVFDDRELLESSKIPHVECDKDHKTLETILDHKDNIRMYAKSRSVISLPSVRMIPEEETSTGVNGDTSSVSSPRNNEGGFCNYQKFVVQKNSSQVSSKISRIEVCGDCLEPIKDKEVVNSKPEATNCVSRNRSVIELFKPKIFNLKRSSSSIISTCDSYKNEIMKRSFVKEVSEAEDIGNFHQIMSMECQKYAKKVRDQAEASVVEQQEFQEIPLDYLLRKRSSNSNCFESRYQLAAEDMSNDSVFSKEDGNSAGSYKSITCFEGKKEKDDTKNQRKPFTNSKPNFAFYSEEKVSILDMMKSSTTSSSSDQTYLIKEKKDKNNLSDYMPQVDLSRQSEKQFFDNLLAFHDKQSEFIKKLVRDDEFFVSLTDFVRNTSDGSKSSMFQNDIEVNKKGRKEKKKGIFSRIFKRREKKSDETLLESSMGKSLSGETASVAGESCVSILNDPDEYEKGDEKSFAKIANAEQFKQLAQRARCHLEPMVKASMTNRQISDKIKLAGFLKLLQMVEKGDFTFLNNGDSNRTLEEKLREHVAQMFDKVYRIADREVTQKNTILDIEKIEQLKILVTKYHMGVDAHINILAIYIGRGLIETQAQLEDAILYLMGLDAQEINLEQFEKHCRINRRSD